MSFPQVVIDEQIVGGYQELISLTAQHGPGHGACHARRDDLLLDPNGRVMVSDRRDPLRHHVPLPNPKKARWQP